MKVQAADQDLRTSSKFSHYVENVQKSSPNRLDEVELNGRKTFKAIREVEVAAAAATVGLSAALTCRVTDRRAAGAAMVRSKQQQLFEAVVSGS